MKTLSGSETAMSPRYTASVVKADLERLGNDIERLPFRGVPAQQIITNFCELKVSLLQYMIDCGLIDP